MEKIITVLQTVLPIFVVVFLGMFARKRQIVSAKDVQGMQSCVVKFCLPCVLFNACLSAQISMESIASMILVFVSVVLTCLWAFRVGRKTYTYHNFPMFYSAMETGMLGIPLFMILFGVEQVYRMSVLDVAQAVVGIMTMAILSTDTDGNLGAGEVAKKVMSSPLLIMAFLGLVLNLSGIAALLKPSGMLNVVTACTEFLAQPVSVLMIFSVGYNFSLEKESRQKVLQAASMRFAVFAVIGILVQLVLFLIPGVDMLTRVALLMYYTLPASYMCPGLGRRQEDYTVASGVCSILTAVSLLVFCGLAVVFA